MARPEVHTLNSYAVSVGWTAPADMHSRRAMAMRRGLLGGAHGSELGKDVDPIGGYRLRYWVRQCRDGQPPVTEYGTMPEYEDVEETWPAAASHAVLKWLVAGRAYIFEVAAFNHAGAGPWSDPSDCFIMPQRPENRQPQPDSFMMGQALASPAHLSPRPDSIEVSWAATCHRGSAITSYDLLCSKDPAFRQVTRQLKTTGESTQLTVKDLEPNTVYYFKHRAVNEKGPSKWSDPTPGVATKAKPPERPVAPARLGDGSCTMPREVAIRWAAPESYGVPIQHYRVRCSTHPDMRNAQEVPVGADSRGTTNLSSNQSECPSSPSSPAGRRPGFNKGHYALTQLKVKGLAPMTTYYFQVQAVNQVGESEWSEASAAMPTTASPPGRAGRPRFCGGTKLGGMRICWTVPECFGARIERYDVRVSRYTMMAGAVEHRDVMTRSADPSILRFTEDELLEATISGCWEPAVDHFYQVRAVNSAGVGDWSESSEAFQVAPERPLRPEAPHSFDSLHRTALVRWKAPDCRGSPITGYRLQYSTARDMHYATEVPGVYGTATEFAVTNLHPQGSYFFQVCALNAVGCSDWSPPSSLVKVRQVAPAKLSAPYLLRETSTSVTVAFTNPADCGTRDGELIQTYILYYCPAGQDGGPVELGSDAKPGSGAGMIPRAQPSGVEVKGLRPGTRYQFQVLACNEYGDGAPSEAVEFGTSSAPPDAPSAPWLAEFTQGSITLAVKPGRDNGAPLTDFDLEVEECETGKRWNMPRIQTCENDDGLQYYAVTGLRPGFPYRFRAAMVNREGDSPYSEPSEEYSTDSTPPEFVHGLRAEDVRARQYRLCWELPYHNGSQVTGYRVQWCQEETFEKSVKQLDVVNERSAVLDDCSPGLPCYARVAARNVKGLGPFCRPLATDLGADVPDAPMHVQPVGVGPINVRLGWIMPYDCGSPITQLWVRYEETGTDKRPEKFRDRGQVLVLGRKRFCSIEPLFSSREYVYRVAAQNAVGIGPWSEASMLTRIGPPVVPTAPLKPIFLEATTTSLVFKWNASEGMGANVLEQIVHVSTDPSFAEGSYLTVSMPPWSATKQRQVGRVKHSAFSPQREDTLNAEDLAEWEIKQGLRKADTSCGSRPLTKSTAPPTAGPPTAGPSTAGPSTAPGAGASRPNTIGASRPVTTGQTLGPVSETASERPPSQQPIQVGGAEVLKLDSSEADEDDFRHENELEMSYAQEVQVRRKSSSCGIDQIDLGCPAAAAAIIGAGDGEDAPQTVQLAETFDDIFPMEGLGAATMQRTSTQYKRPELIGEYVIPDLHPGTHYYVRVTGRNMVGLGAFSAASERVATFATVPRSIPEDPGIVLLRTGCTSLTLGWSRADCQGMPITHYILRCSETMEGLDAEDCKQFEHDEYERETWPGIVEPQPHPYPLCPPDELDVGGKDGIVAFATYLMQRYSSIEESWEWLDVNGSGDISKQEFVQGDEDDGGAPFEDFPGGPEALENVWKHLDADGGGVIGMSEYGRLKPYFDSVRGGGAGVDFKGVYCLVPSLKPGKTYYFMARSVNKLGMSPWVHCSANPIKTDTMTPATMDMVEAVRELRTTSSVTLRWTLPWDGGNALTKLELRYQVRDIDDGVPDRAALREGELVELHGEDDGKGPLQTQLCISGLLPGQVVIAIARAFNRTGGSRMWSETPNASKDGHYQEAVCEWDCTTLPAPPELPTVLPYFRVDSLESYKCESKGEICFNIGRHNGAPFKAFDFEILDSDGELFRWWTTASGPEETAEAMKRNGLVRREFLGLKPGLTYRVRVRCSNLVGASAWSELGPWATMPPDVPLDPDAPRSEFTSLSWVELKFIPPRDNGAKIEEYSVRTTMVEEAEEDDWRVLTQEEVEESLRPYVSTGRRVQARDVGSMLCRVSNLKTGTSHFFSVRVRNSVGWSMWSEVSCFVTKPARPGRVPSVASTHATARDIDVDWEEPELNDSPANRYELIVGSNLKILRWAQLVGVLLCTMPDTDRLFGELSPPELGTARGQPALRDLVSEETLFLALDGKHREHRVNNLLAGQDYYVAVRVVTTAGRGEFSEIFGPFETGPEKPCNPLPMEAQPLSEHSCRLLIKLPYDNGLPIHRASVVVHRSFGPLSHDELDLDTGDAQDHIARRELVFDPKELPKIDLPGAAPASTRLKPAGITEAVFRGYRNEGLGPEAVGRDPNAHTRDIATGQQHAILLEDLRPGTNYRAQWAVSNDLGWSAWTVPEVVFETEPSHPDKPVSMEIHGSL